jgi:hypothetical protein
LEIEQSDKDQETNAYDVNAAAALELPVKYDFVI